MKTDVFVRVHSATPFRHYLACAVIERIRMFDDARLQVIVSGETFMECGAWPIAARISSVLAFARSSREIADRLAMSPVYVLVDDDHLPIGKDWVAAGVTALEARPGFAMLSSWSVNAEVDPTKWTFDRTGCRDDDEVFEAPSAGTPCWVRKGTFVDLPEAPAPAYDSVLSEHLKRKGRIGFLRGVRHNHLGYEYSQVVDGHWAA